MERYQDAHPYVANRCTRRAMFRLPCDPPDPERDCATDQASAWIVGDDIVLNFTSNDEGGAFGFDYDAEVLPSALVGIRAELAAGDRRPLYLAWSAAYGAWATRRLSARLGGRNSRSLRARFPPRYTYRTRPTGVRSH